jgi:23S rRNA pseudouridine1911/1915/1917 synthase
MFARREIEKKYLAVCVGSPGDREINEPIKRHPTKRKEMAVHPEGKAALSKCRVLHFDGKLALVEVSPVTGRTHQIRVHLKSVGTPVLGDEVYGFSAWNKRASRLMLHASRLRFTHPISGQLLDLAVPTPPEFVLDK